MNELILSLVVVAFVGGVCALVFTGLSMRSHRKDQNSKGRK